MSAERIDTRVVIVGAGPAGLLLGRSLDLAGIDNVIVESQSREHVEARQRAGMIEQGTVDFMTELGVDGRLRREGLVHGGIELRFAGQSHRIAMDELTGGRTVTVYAQTEIVRDLITARLADGGPLLFETEATAIRGLDGERPLVIAHRAPELTDPGARDGARDPDIAAAPAEDADADLEIRGELVAACDGFHGIGRGAVPDGALQTAGREYPYAWLGILADAPPSCAELIYCHSERGFALHSMRSPDVGRLYLQVDAEERIEDWPDERIWEELATRLATDGWTLTEGPITEKSVTRMRSFVAWPLRHGRLLLAGDAAHIVPPTGAKGLNLAAADARLLAGAITASLLRGDDALLDAYSDTALRRVWRAQDFSFWMTTMLHLDPDDESGYGRRLQEARLAYVTSSEAAARTLAENYVGLVRV